MRGAERQTLFAIFEDYVEGTVWKDTTRERERESEYNHALVNGGEQAGREGTPRRVARSQTPRLVSVAATAHEGRHVANGELDRDARAVEDKDELKVPACSDSATRSVSRQLERAQRDELSPIADVRKAKAPAALRSISMSALPFASRMSV